MTSEFIQEEKEIFLTMSIIAKPLFAYAGFYEAIANGNLSQLAYAIPLALESGVIAYNLIRSHGKNTKGIFGIVRDFIKKKGKEAQLESMLSESAKLGDIMLTTIPLENTLGLEGELESYQ